MYGLVRRRTGFVDGAGDITLARLLDRERTLGDAACRIAVRVAVTLVNGPLEDAIIPPVHEIWLGLN